MSDHVLPAEHLSQRDNKIDPRVTCAPTCAAMFALTALLPYYSKHFSDAVWYSLDNWTRRNAAQLEDFISESVGKNREDFNHLSKFLKSEFCLTTQVKKISQGDIIPLMIETDYPVIMNTGKSLTAYGHIILARGYTDDRWLIVNDPFGKAPYKTTASGEAVRYPLAALPPYVWTLSRKP